MAGLSPGPAFEFFTDSSSTGTVSFDLTSLTGETLGLQFQLSALFSDTGFDSTLTVSNVRLEQSGAPAVPEPMSLAVWAVLCCTAAVGSRYRRFARH